MTRADAVLESLARGLPVVARVVVVVAHPDDEAVSLGGVLPRLQDATVVQVTDGGTDLPRLWAGAGVDSRDAYAAVREAERVAAWRAAKWRLPHRSFGVPDRQVHAQIAPVMDRLRLALAGADVVITHPYEGGHPDHDACAFAVQTVCDQTGARAPARIEFASYHYNGRRMFGAFYGADPAPILVTVHGKSLLRKRRALAAYRTQARILGRFPITVEPYRLAPRYDFTRPAPPPVCLYERRGLPLTAVAWRSVIARAA